MSVVVHPAKILNFNNIIDKDKAQKLQSIHYISFQIPGHSNNYQCYCFLCWLFKLLLTVLLFRKYGKLYMECAVHMNNFSNTVNLQK